MVATAASLLVAAAVLSDPPAWAAAFRALSTSIGDFDDRRARRSAALTNSNIERDGAARR